MRQIIREHQKIEPSNGVVLIWNGRELKDPNETLSVHGIRNNSQIICIISKKTGRDIEHIADEIKEEVKNEDRVLKPALQCKFHKKPLGFGVWADETGNNAIVIRVSGKHALNSGVKIGYCVYKLNNELMFGRKHEEVLDWLKKVKCPLSVWFLDFGQEYTITFPRKPLGFSVIQDWNKRNAKVSKINTGEGWALGVKIGSYIIGVNNQDVFGMKHRKIIAILQEVGFPITIKFRHTPKLLMVNSKIRKREASPSDIGININSDDDCSLYENQE